MCVRAGGGGVRAAARDGDATGTARRRAAGRGRRHDRDGDVVRGGGDGRRGLLWSSGRREGEKQREGAGWGSAIS